MYVCMYVCTYVCNYVCVCVCVCVCVYVCAYDLDQLRCGMIFTNTAHPYIDNDFNLVDLRQIASQITAKCNTHCSSYKIYCQKLLSKMKIKYQEDDIF